jgi:hypothetical protein
VVVRSQTALSVNCCFTRCPKHPMLHDDKGYDSKSAVGSNVKAPRLVIDSLKKGISLKSSWRISDHPAGLFVVKGA